MQELTGKVAVVTGGASGIGRAMAERFAAAGMRVALADVEAGALATTVAELEDSGATVCGVVCDVRSASSVADVHHAVIDTFGAVHVVCLNAGVAPTGPLLNTSLDTWRWVVDVNLMGVVNGIAVFAPALVAAGEGHIVCTASAAGLVPTVNLGAYCATKHAVVGLAETLRLELSETGVGVSVLCPALVQTRIFESERNRPAEHGGPVHTDPATADLLRAALAAGGIPPAQVAQAVFEAVVNNRLYVLPHPEVVDWVRARADAVAEDGR
jgi:NAD(P)-dependent dehydrogenase (short-subunit alcohol dehydrogenase family)